MTPFSLFKRRPQDHQTRLVQRDQYRIAPVYTKTTAGGEHRPPAPIASISVGTAGLRRNRRFVQNMSRAGCTDRIQSIFVYDCNQRNIQLWRETQSDHTRDITMLPNYLPLSEGFLRRTDRFHLDGHYPSIERDVEEMADELVHAASLAGNSPQLIIEWFGFGGHAQLTRLIHDIIEDRFPNATFLPVWCIPNEGVLESMMRNQVLEEAIQANQHRMNVLTDNAISHKIANIDERIAIALTGIESAYKANPEFGTLAEITNMFSLAGGHWLGIAETHVPLRTTSNSIIMGKDDNALLSIKGAIWDIADVDNRQHELGHYASPDIAAEQRIVVAVPLDHEHIDELRDDLMDQLRREKFDHAYPNTKIGWAPANFLWSEKSEPEPSICYAHITKLFNLGSAPQPTIERVLHPESPMAHLQDGPIMTRGHQILRDHMERQTNGAVPTTNHRSIAL